MFTRDEVLNLAVQDAGTLVSCISRFRQTGNADELSLVAHSFGCLLATCNSFLELSDNEEELKHIIEQVANQRVLLAIKEKEARRATSERTKSD